MAGEPWAAFLLRCGAAEPCGDARSSIRHTWARLEACGPSDRHSVRLAGARVHGRSRCGEIIMTPPTNLVALLGEALGLPIAWDDLILIRNFGSLRLDAPLPDGVETRGFHARLLSKDGRCTHYVKCRSAVSVNAAREAAVLATLRADPSLAEVVPLASTLVLPGLRAIIMEVVTGTTFARRVAQTRLSTAVAESSACLAVRNRLVEGATNGGLLPQTAGPFDPLQELEPSLRVLGQFGSPPPFLPPSEERLTPTSPPRHNTATSRLPISSGARTDPSYSTSSSSAWSPARSMIPGTLSGMSGRNGPKQGGWGSSRRATGGMPRGARS